MTAVVTGAASGLGLEFSKLLAEDGYELIMVDSNASGLEEANRLLGDHYKVAVKTVAIDLGRTSAAEEVFAGIGDRGIDVLVNNAGFGLYGFFAETDWETEEAMIRLHVLTLTHLTKLILKDMIRKGSGRILNVSSMAAFQPGPLMSVYYATKAYILSFSEALANEVMGTGVSVTVLAPGWFKTNFQKTTALNSDVEESKARLHTVTAEKVALRGYRGMMSGKTVVVPGIHNKLMTEAGRILPRKSMTAIIRRIQERLRK